jgi:hypothetical protein
MLPVWKKFAYMFLTLASNFDFSFSISKTFYWLRQVSALLIRPKKTVKVRFYWNLYHWSVGYTVVVMSVFNVFSGIGILQPDQKYKRAYIGVVLVLAVVAFVMEAVTLTVRFKKGRR